MPTQSNLPYQEQYNQPYRQLMSGAVGRTQLDALVGWTLDARTTTLKLSNAAGAHYELGQVQHPTKHCSLAFLNHTKPYMVLEDLYGDKTIYRIILKDDSVSVESLDIDLSQYRDITLCYWRPQAKEQLIVTALGPKGVYRGLLSEDGKLNLVLFNRVDVDNPPISLQRVGVNIANQLQTEIVEIAQHN